MRLLSSIKEAISTFCLLMIVITILASIVARAAFNRPIMWSMELTSILVIWSVYLVFGINYKEHKHFSIDLLKEHLPEKYHTISEMFNDIIIFLTLITVMYYCGVAMRINYNMTTMALDISVALVYYLPVMIGSASLLLYMGLKYWKKYKGA